MKSEEKKVKRILIVEDDVSMRIIYQNMFKNLGDQYETEITTNGMDAFRKLQEEKFDLILLDVIMEPVQGDSLFAVMKEDPKAIQIPTIVVTVLDRNNRDVDYILGREKTSYLKKPITKEQLLEEINKYLPQAIIW